MLHSQFKTKLKLSSQFSPATSKQKMVRELRWVKLKIKNHAFPQIFLLLLIFETVPCVIQRYQMILNPSEQSKGHRYQLELLITTHQWSCEYIHTYLSENGI